MGLKKNSLYLLLLNGLTLVSGAVTSVLVARTLGAEGKGILYLVFLLPQFVASLGGLGVRAAATYFGGKGVDRARLFRHVMLVGLGLSVLYVLLGASLRGVIAGTILKGLENRWVLLSLALIPVYLFWSYADGMLQGMKRFGIFTAAQVTSLILRLGLLALFLIVMEKDVAWAVAAYVAAIVIPAGITFTAVAFNAHGGGELLTLRELFGYGLKVYWGTLAQRANLRLDVFVLNPHVGAAGVGVYSVATLLAELVWQAPRALSQVLLPHVAGSEAKEAARLTAFASRQTLLLSLTLSVALAVLAHWIVLLLFKEEFLGAVQVLWSLLPGVVAISVSMVLAPYLTGAGHPTLNSTASIVAFAINVPALLLMVPKWGIVGAGLATSLAYIVQTAVVVYFYATRSGEGFRSPLIPRREDFAVYRAQLAALRKK